RGWRWRRWCRLLVGLLDAGTRGGEILLHDGDRIFKRRMMPFDIFWGQRRFHSRELARQRRAGAVIDRLAHVRPVIGKTGDGAFKDRYVIGHNA
ncbi:hypothetical protein CKO32_15705, partial [Afifella marina DSM 2698]|nr:hypothetical protein [Afifella marina DSM 2698]